jgi:MFS family permease
VVRAKARADDRERPLSTLGESASGFRAVWANRDLRRLEIAWAGSVIAHYGFQIALGVYAYEIGGALAVGAMFVLRTLGALATPPAAALGDRYPRIRVMVGSDLVRALLVVLTFFVIWTGGPAAIVYALAGLVVVVGTAFRPAQVAVLPQLAETPEELTAANVVATTIESVGMFVGPAVAGLVLALSGIPAALVVTAVAFLWSALLLVPVKAPPPPAARREHIPVGEQLFAGFGVTWRDRDLRVLTGVLSGQALTAGCINVLIVVTALGLLELGQGGVGLLDAAVGVGGLAGAILAVPLVGRKRLAIPLIVGAVLWSLPLVGIAALPEVAVAFVAFAVIGVGNTLLDVAAFTLLQRIAADDVLARVFGVAETMFYLGIGIGSLIAPLLVESVGARVALVVVGLMLPLFVAVRGGRILAVDAATTVPEHEVALLRLLPMFAPLSPLAVERLARQSRALEVASGTEVVRQGDPGDLFYVIDGGEFAVLRDGARVATLRHGDGFGEIALLRDQPRIATVIAETEARLYTLERDVFLSAVAGHSESEEAANALVTARLTASLGSSLR